MNRNRATRNLLSVFAVILTVLVFTVMMVGCGGSGGGSPTAPKITPTPTPPGPPVQPSISLDASTPDCGSTLPVNQFVNIKVYVVVPSGGGGYLAYATLYDAQGKTVSSGGTNPEIFSTGYYYITKTTNSPVTSVTMLLRLTNSAGQDLNPPVTQTVTCGFTWQ